MRAVVEPVAGSVSGVRDQGRAAGGDGQVQRPTVPSRVRCFRLKVTYEEYTRVCIAQVRRGLPASANCLYRPRARPRPPPASHDRNLLINPNRDSVEIPDASRDLRLHDGSIDQGRSSGFFKIRSIGAGLLGFMREVRRVKRLPTTAHTTSAPPTTDSAAHANAVQAKRPALRPSAPAPRATATTTRRPSQHSTTPKRAAPSSAAPTTTTPQNTLARRTPTQPPGPVANHLAARKRSTAAAS